VLTTGGHNVGIVNPPRSPDSSPRVSHRVGVREAQARYVAPDAWPAQAQVRPGSWWPTWHEWLAGHSGRALAPLPIGGTGRRRLQTLEDAPGTYVLQA
jgi:polyhydroxyalkanoate synthase